MPIYAYVCADCGQGKDCLVPSYKMRERPDDVCPCGSRALQQRGLSAPAIGKPEFFGYRDQSGRNIKASLRHS